MPRSTQERTTASNDTSVGQVPMERLRTIFDGMFDGVWLVGSDGRTTYANAAIAGMLGTTPSDMHGRPLTDYLSAEFRMAGATLIDEQRASTGDRVDLRFLTSDGADLWALVAASPILSSGGSYVGAMLNVSDVTGKRAAQNQALQNQKLEAIGAFAAGISHDFNNLLTSIRGFAELAEAELEEGSAVRADLDQVIASADRARGITSKLSAFIHRQVLVPIPVDPARVISDLMPILRPLLSEDVTIVLDMERGRSSILIDPIALEQVLINLAVNAHDAMPLGGTMTITLDEVPGHGREALGADVPAPPSVRLRITDSGGGMDEKTAARVFDPFFTTKEFGKGTGLGLSTAYGLVTQSGGSIHVESSLGSGTTFTVLLPRSLLKAGSTTLEPATDVPTVRAGVVLIVEDWTSIREFARRVLTKAGHTAVAVGSSDQALQAAADWAGDIDVLLTDVVMPGMQGPELASRILERRPGTAVIYMSGYSLDTFSGPTSLGPTASFLAKPFTAEMLLAAIAHAMSSL